MITRFEVWEFPEGVGEDKPYNVCGIGDDMDGPASFATEEEARTVLEYHKENGGTYRVVKLTAEIL